MHLLRFLTFTFLNFTLPSSLCAAASTDAETAEERYYCTQFGPFFIRFDQDKAAGVFAIHGNGDMGAIVGKLEGRHIEGHSYEEDNHGQIRIDFSEDWASFDAAYSVAADPENWRTGWRGQLRPSGKTLKFEKDGEAYQCKKG